MAGLSVLYHPYFEPDVGQLRSALLISDAVHSIVPMGARYAPSDQIARHLDALPGTFVPTPPEEDDTEITKDYFALNGLRNAFSQIAIDVSYRRLPGSMSEEGPFGPERLAIGNATLIHGFKIAGAVHSMLRDAGLVYGEREDGYFLVDERAAHLIVSFLAQRMSRRLALRTLTGVEDSYYLSTACDVYDWMTPDKNAYFASSILRLHIPAEIEAMDLNQFAEFRKRYAALREMFPVYLADLKEVYCIDDVRTAKELQAKLAAIGQMTEQEMTRIRASRAAELIHRWIPIGLGSALSVGAAFFSGPDAALGSAIGTIAVTLIGEALRGPQMVGRFHGARSLLLSARDDVLKASRLHRFLNMEPLRP